MPAAYAYTASDAGSHAFSVTLNTAGTWSVTATSGSVTGSETGIVVDDSIWALNSNNRLVKVSDAGAQLAAETGTNSGPSTLGALAFDNAGNVWATQENANTIIEFSTAGTLIRTVGAGTGGLDAPVALAFDGLGQIWAVDTAHGSVTTLSATGTAVSPSAGYQKENLGTPVAVVIDSSGSVWIASSGNTVTKLIGAAGPVAEPLVTDTINKTLGTKP